MRVDKVLNKNEILNRSRLVGIARGVGDINAKIECKAVWMARYAILNTIQKDFLRLAGDLAFILSVLRSDIEDVFGPITKVEDEGVLNKKCKRGRKSSKNSA